MQKNEKYRATITNLTLEGNGVCHIDGMVVFVPHTAIGDEISVQIVKVLPKYAYGRVVEIITPSPDRIDPLCPYSTCGGCLFWHIRYEAELAVKEKAVIDAFTRIGKLSPTILPIVESPTQTHYRNKAQYPFARDSEGKPILGFYARRSHRVIPVAQCPLQPRVFGEIVTVVLDYVQAHRFSIYDETTGNGILRHLYLRCGAHSGQIGVCFVVRRSLYRQLMPLARQLIARFPNIVSVSENINPEKTNVILGETTTPLIGPLTVSDTMCGIPVDLSPTAFYQVNTLAAEKLYSIAGQFAKLTGKELLLDLYCGVGTIGLSLATRVGRLVGVEIIPKAVENAYYNAARAGITNAKFICGDVGKVAQDLLESGQHPDVVMIDPPRRGCDGATIEVIEKMHPSRIVMISCNPSTAARDCSLLSKEGYVVKCVQPVDLFPRTGHVECVVLLEAKA